MDSQSGGRDVHALRDGSEVTPGIRLLVVSQYFWPEDFRINDLVAELGRRGHHVTVLTGVPNYPEGVVRAEYRSNPAQFGAYAGAEVIRVPMVPRGSTGLQLLLNYATFMLSAATIGAWRLRGRPFEAIFVFQVSPVTQCIPAMVLGRLKRAAVIIWVLDLWPDTLAAVGAVRSPWLLRTIGRAVAFIYRHSQLVLAQSRAFLPAINRATEGRTPVRFFPAWVEPLFQGGLDSVDAAPEVREFGTTFNVLFAGNIGESQDFPSILDAAERLRDRQDIRWLIVGDGRAADWVRGEVARRGLEASVRLLGRHPVERMPSFFRAADVLLVTLKRDPVFAMTIPGKLQTYLATGLPIVALLDGEGARVLDESGAGMVGAAGDSAALADQVIRMSALAPATRAAMGASGRNYAAQEYDRDTLLTGLEQWFGELASSRSA